MIPTVPPPPYPHPSCVCPNGADHLRASQTQVMQAVTQALHREAASGRLEAAGLEQARVDQFMSGLYAGISAHVSRYYTAMARECSSARR